MQDVFHLHFRPNVSRSCGNEPVSLSVCLEPTYVARQHCGRTAVCGRVTTNSGRRVVTHVTFEVMSVRKPLLSTSAPNRQGVRIIFSHDYGRIIFQNVTANLFTHDCQSYIHFRLAGGTPPRRAMVMRRRR